MTFFCLQSSVIILSIFAIQINQGLKQLAKSVIVYLHGNQKVFEIGISSKLVTYKELESLRKMDTFFDRDNFEQKEK